MTTKLYYYIATGRRHGIEVTTGSMLAPSKENVIGIAYSTFEKRNGFKPEAVEVVEITKEEIRGAMPGALSAHIGNGMRSVTATLADDTIVFHVAFKSADPAAIAHAMAEVEKQPTEEEFMEALKIVMGNCPFLKDFKND